MKFLHANGLQVGKTAEMHPLMEGRIRDKFYKPTLRHHGFDPMAQSHLPPPGWKPEVPQAKETILSLSEVEDFDKPWGFKGVKGLLMWKLLHEAFPGAKWVVIYRERAEHVQSLLRTGFMNAYTNENGWAKYLNEINAHIATLVNARDVDLTIFSPATLRDDKDNDDYLHGFCEWVGLEYNPRSKKVFDRKLYRRQ